MFASEPDVAGIVGGAVGGGNILDRAVEYRC